MMAQSLRVPFDGTDMGDGKSQAPGLCNTFLGVEHDFRPFAASRFSLASVDATCIRDIAGVLQEVLDASSLDAVDGGVPKRGCLRPPLAFALARKAQRSERRVRCV